MAVQGWTETSPLRAIDVARQFADEPLAAIVYTDISTDGMLAGPNLSAMTEMQAAVDRPVVASGGVTTVDDVARLAAIPMAGCIIGRALYERTLTLPEALLAAGDGEEAGAAETGGQVAGKVDIIEDSRSSGKGINSWPITTSKTSATLPSVDTARPGKRR